MMKDDRKFKSRRCCSGDDDVDLAFTSAPWCDSVTNPVLDSIEWE